jgi:hypothetical protein
MSHTATLLLALASAFTPASEDGAAWIHKAEANLYRWQKPGSVVSFDLRTDVLAGSIAAMERDLQKKPDRDAECLVRALEHLVIHGKVDTATGAVETQIAIDCDVKDPKGKAAIEKMKVMLGDFVRLAFDGLPFKDPTLIARNAAVVSAEIQGDHVIVVMGSDRPGEPTTLEIDRRSTLPTHMRTPAGNLDYAYTEVAPGHFAPTRLDVQGKSGPSRSAEYTYQNLGNVVFPQSIKLSQGEQSSRISIESVKIEARAK